MTRDTLYTVAGASVLVSCIALGGLFVVLKSQSSVSTPRGGGQDATATTPPGSLFEPKAQAAQNSPTATSPSYGSGVTDLQRIAVLKSVQRALAAYFRLNQRYPAKLTDVSRDTFSDMPVVDSSYSYSTDAPDLDAYSICTTLKDSTYECVSSSVGEAPFGLSKASIDESIHASWKFMNWKMASSSEILTVAFPPGWADNFGGQTDTSDLLGQTESGQSVVIARFNFTNYLPYTPSETAEDFAAHLISSYGSNTTVQRSKSLIISGRNGYEIGATQQEGAQRYGFIAFLFPNPNGFSVLNFFIDAGMSERLLPALETMAGSISITP